MQFRTFRFLRAQLSWIGLCAVLVGLTGWGFSVRTAKAYRALKSPLENIPAVLKVAPLYVGVDITATGGTLNASYATLQAAFAAINAGTHTGAITLDLTADTTETASAVLNASGSGSASYTAITIKPAGGATRTISGSLNAPLIDLSGADNVTIDGLNTGGNALTVTNTSNTAAAATVRFINGATNNIIQNTTFNGATTGTSLGTVFFSTDGITPNGNDNNQITNCDIGPAGANFPVNAIYSAGTTSTAAKNNSGNTVANCRIFDFYAADQNAGVLLAGGNTDWTISGSSFYQTAARTGFANTAQYGIFINNTNGNNFNVTGNFIGGSAANAGGSPWSVSISGSTLSYRFIGIQLAVGTATTSNIQNNTITNFNWKTSSTSASAPGVWCGLFVSNGNVNVGTVTGNTVGSGTGNDAIVISASSTGATTYGMATNGSGSITSSNNTIGSISVTGITASGASSNATGPALVGMLANATTKSLMNNLIGSLTTAQSLRNCTATSNATCFINGIQTTGNAIISNNTVANLTSLGSGGGLTQTKGIVAGSAVTTINDNTIHHLTTTTIHSGGAPLHVGIETQGGSGTLAGNTIYALSNTYPTANGAGISGIVVKGDQIVERNLIHSFTTVGDGGVSWVTALNVENAGTKTIRNNIIRLGLDENGNSVTAGIDLFGIFLMGSVGGAITNIYHNTIYLAGTGVNNISQANAICILTNNNGPIDLRNNILVNTRTFISSATLNFAIYYNPTPTGNQLTANGNLYYVTGTALGNQLAFAANGFCQALAQLQNALNGQDANSAMGNPNFINPNGTTTTLDFHLGSPTPAEGSGVSLPSVTDDFDGQTRSALTPIDIGADALNATGIDIFAPVITYATFANTGSTANRTLTVMIADITGVPTTGALVPRIYYRKNSGAYFSQPGTLTAGTGTNGTWDFTINYADVGGVICGDKISYFVIAQDTVATPNIVANLAGASATNVNTIITPPTTPNSYRIRFFGTINVGTGQAYPTLTPAGGLFEAINASGLSANTTINIISNLTTESGATPLNEWVEEGAGNYTLTIQPGGGAAREIIGNSNDMIRLEGADRVTIDGLNSGGNSLTLRNSNTFASTLLIINDASNNTIQNCTIEGNRVSGSVITLGAGTTTGNDNITVANNIIRQNGALNAPAVLISSSGTSTAISNSNITVSNNQLLNFTVNGINLNNTANDNWTISGNTIYQTLARTSALAGINLNATGINTITQNVIRDFNSTGLKQGISIGTVSAGTTISRNRIYNFSGTGAMYGIDFSPQLGATSHVVLVNNQITLTAIGTSQSIIGIRDSSTNASAASLTASYNSVFIGGTATGTVTQALRIETSAKATTLRNNLLVNTRSGGSVTHYALDRASNAGTFSSNHNFLVGTGSSTTGNYLRQATTDYDFASWKASLSFDLNSFATIASGINTNVFTDIANGNLDINSNGDVPTLDLIARHATPLAITTDFSNATRHATTPDIGADEFNVLPVVIPLAGPVRTQGNPVNNSAIATATDLEDLETALALAVSSDGITFGSTAALNGVTINNLAINASGNVTADVVAICTATATSFTLRVTDLESGATIATINVTVNPNTPPVLSYQPAFSIPAGCPLIVTPLTGASDNFQVASVAVHNVSPALTFTPTVSLAGIVTIPAANPGGLHTITIRATDNCGLTTDATFTLDVITLTLQSAANLSSTVAAPGSVVTTQGRFFTATQATANALPLPTTLAGVTVNVTDSASVTRTAELFYATPTLLSFIVPSATATGTATVSINTVNNGTFTHPLIIANVAPGVFTVDQQTNGLASGYVIRENGATQTIEPIARFNSTMRQWEAVPIDVTTGTVYLVLNGSGFRNGGLFNVTVGSTAVSVNFAGAATSPPGYDQVKVELPAALAGTGTVNVLVSANSQTANTVRLLIQ